METEQKGKLSETVNTDHQTIASAVVEMRGANLDGATHTKARHGSLSIPNNGFALRYSLGWEYVLVRVLEFKSEQACAHLCSYGSRVSSASG